MGVNDRANDAKQNKRDRAKQARSRRTERAGSVSWEGFDWACVIALTEGLAEAAGALRIGTTRDGGAWAFGVYLGDDYATEYVRPSEDFEVAMREIADAWLPAGADVWWERVLAIRAAR